MIPTKDMFKRSWFCAALVPALALSLAACSDDDESFATVDGAAPTIALSTDRI